MILLSFPIVSPRILKDHCIRQQLAICTRAVLTSVDGAHWTKNIDHSQDLPNSPHNYEVFPKSVSVRYIRVVNTHSPYGAKFSLSDLRVFGNAKARKPRAVLKLSATRDSADRRLVRIDWQPAPDAEFYIVRIQPNSMQSMAAASPEERHLSLFLRLAKIRSQCEMAEILECEGISARAFDCAMSFA